MRKLARHVGYALLYCEMNMGTCMRLFMSLAISCDYWNREGGGVAKGSRNRAKIHTLLRATVGEIEAQSGLPH